jgi:hypothetical protein
MFFSSFCCDSLHIKLAKRDELFMTETGAPLEPQPSQIWNSFGVIENTCRTYFDNINHEVSEL